MRLRDDPTLYDLVAKLHVAGFSVDETVRRILDAVERHQQAALAAVGGATGPRCACCASVHPNLPCNSDCPCWTDDVPDALAEPPTTPPQAGAARMPTCLLDIAEDEARERGFGRTPSSPPVDPSDPTRARKP
jgi:hypothetical protein